MRPVTFKIYFSPRFLANRLLTAGFLTSRFLAAVFSSLIINMGGLPLVGLPLISLSLVGLPLAQAVFDEGGRGGSYEGGGSAGDSGGSYYNGFDMRNSERMPVHGCRSMLSPWLDEYDNTSRVSEVDETPASDRAGRMVHLGDHEDDLLVGPRDNSRLLGDAELTEADKAALAPQATTLNAAHKTEQGSNHHNGINEDAYINKKYVKQNGTPPPSPELAKNADIDNSDIK